MDPEGAGKRFSGILQRVGSVSSRGYVGILLSGAAYAVNQGGTADRSTSFIRPWQKKLCRDFITET